MPSPSFTLVQTYDDEAIWHADLAGDSAGPAGGAAVASVIVVAALALAAKPLIRLDGPAYTSVFQGVIRWNSFVFLPVVQAAFGPQGLAVAAVMIACIIPVTNIACVAVLARWGADKVLLAENPELSTYLVAPVAELLAAAPPATWPPSSADLRPMLSTTARPRPVPSPSALRVKKASKRRGMSSSAMPLP